MQISVALILLILTKHDMTPQNSNNPFLQLKVRSLLLRFLLVTIVVGIRIGVIQRFSGLKINDKLMTPIIYILVFGLLCLWVLADFNRLRINLNYVIGRLPNNQRWLPLVGLVISDLAPLRINPGNAKICAIRLPDFYWFVSLNQGFQFSTE